MGFAGRAHHDVAPHSQRRRVAVTQSVRCDQGGRAALFDEALATIRTIWTNDEVSVDGHALTARGITAHLRPPSHPHPPVWIGGNGGGASRGGHGDG
jgi:alkanesulfonate monooxygenase SsuD/methylene tetrahydromethanopterin reductase-like flavin-dependent oxidoreductase (luciferase family)